MPTGSKDQKRPADVIGATLNRGEAMQVIRLSTLVLACIVSGCGGEETYVGVPSSCTESYEMGIRDVCNDIHRLNSDLHDTLRQEKICF